jgi:predicted TIM-barrel fold metal-dependent hydrolase
MTYAGGRRVLDADSHLMELPGFLADHADPRLRARLPDITSGIASLDLDSWAGRHGHDAARVDELVGLGDDLVRRGPKWHGALGAFNPRERSLALDLLGFERQVVFSSLCAPLFALTDPDLRYGAYRAHNRAMAAFCAGDARLLGVALADFDDVDRARAELEAAVDLGLRLVWLPARAPGGRSPGHVDHEPLWAFLAEAGLPFALHVGSGPIPIDDEWMNDGRPERRSARGGGEVVGSKDVSVIFQPAERFVSILLLDGVLDAHPDLRGGVFEMGAGWVPALLRRLDLITATWSKSEPHLRDMTRTPSEQIRDQLRFTPYPFEDVGRLVEESAPELFLFSSDYPHAEGGRDPIGRFEASLAPSAGTGGDDVRRAFFGDNLAALFRAA